MAPDHPGARRLELESAAPEATEALAECLGELLGAGAVVALDGELGAGKTTFTRGLCRGLGVLDPVRSPTFALMHEYAGRTTVRHFDAWMQGREEAFLDGGGAEWFDGEAVAVVEWASRVEDRLPPDRLQVTLAHAGPPEVRRLGLVALGPGAAAVLERLRGTLPQGVRDLGDSGLPVNPTPGDAVGGRDGAP